MNKTIEEFAQWLGLEPGRRYKFKDDDKIFTISKFYNIYYEGEGIGISLASLSLLQLLSIEEVNN